MARVRPAGASVRSSFFRIYLCFFLKAFCIALFFVRHYLIYEMAFFLLFLRVDYHDYAHFGSMLHYSELLIMQMYAGLILFREFSDVWDWYRFLL